MKMLVAMVVLALLAACAPMPSDPMKVNPSPKLSDASTSKPIENEQKVLPKITVTEPHTKIALDQEFTVPFDIIVDIDTKLEMQVVEVVNSTCPPGAQCIWSGKGLIMSYSDGKTAVRGLDLHEVYGYNIERIDSDFQTSATFKVTKLN